MSLPKSFGSQFHPTFQLLALPLFLFFYASPAFAAEDPFAAAIETARRTRDEVQLQSIKLQLDQRIAQNAKDAQAYYDLAQVQAYLADAYEMRKDKKSAADAIDRAIEAAQHSLQENDKSAEGHSLLADLYGRKISFGGMFAGAKFGPKVTEENKRAMALDDKNPRVWASLGRQYLMAPKMFGGDVSKAIESFQKSLALNPSQEETWLWLARAFEKQSDKKKAVEALQKALELNPQNPLSKAAFMALQQ